MHPYRAERSFKIWRVMSSAGLGAQERYWPLVICFPVSLASDSDDCSAMQVDAAKNLALYSPEGMNRAVQRYETCWLPLLAKHRGVRDMGAPLDVAWAWLMHALAPSKYAADVQSIAGVAASAIQADSPQHRSPEAMSNVSET